MVSGWKTKKLGEVAEVCMCKRIFAHQTSKIGTIPFYKIGTFGKEADAYISSQLYEDYKAKYSYPEKGDVLISAAGTLGRTVVFDGRPAYFQDSNIVWLKIDKSQLSNDYLAQYYKVIKWASSEGSTISRLYNGIIRDTEILLPPLNEQAAIAKALSDADSLISSLQKLIEKKKAIKQGAMQELLTGKKRLPGFGGEWKKERLGDISDIKDGTHGTFQRVDRGYPLLSAKNVYNNHLDIAENESLISSEDYYSIIANGFPRKGDILLSCVGTIGRCCIYSGMPKVAFQRSVAFIRVKECVARYILQYMQSENANKQLLNSANASAQAGVYLGAISDIEVYMPCCVKEQQAIAQVLSDMDSEIEQQEKKLAKYQQIKQGMMQELLTGRIRLKKGEMNV